MACLLCRGVDPPHPYRRRPRPRAYFPLHRREQYGRGPHRFHHLRRRRRHAPYDSRDAETQGRCTFRYAGEDHRREIGSARNRREGCDLHLHQLRLGNIRRRRQQVDHPCQDFGCSRRREHRPGYRPEYDRRSTYGYVHRYGRFENGDRHRHPESRRTEGFRQQFFSSDSPTRIARRLPSPSRRPRHGRLSPTAG